jgi:glycosyltransferase involved in cell wall biosynthesis
MNVTVSVFGRFHAFYLAHQLHQRGHLQRLITTYPKFEVEKYGIPRDRTTSLLKYALLHRGWNRWLPDWMKPDKDLRVWFANAYDRAAAQQISKDTDIYIGWSSKTERGLERARTLGTTTVVERGSSHIEFQRDILREEYTRYGLEGSLPLPEIVEKEKREYALADYIAIPSSYVRRTFLEKGIPEEKLIQVPYGVDLSSFRPVPKEDNVFRVVFAGSMIYRKGVHYLLQAFDELQLPNAELWLLGSMTPELQPFFDKYERTFRHFGHIPQPELHEYYSQCSVFAMCSIEEGMAMVQAQAMACGLPLICTTNTGGEDLIREGEEGFVLPIRDVEALKEKILWCYEHQDQCEAMGQAAKERVSEEYSWDDYGERITQSYQEILSRSDEG